MKKEGFGGIEGPVRAFMLPILISITWGGGWNCDGRGRSTLPLHCPPIAAMIEINFPKNSSIVVGRTDHFTRMFNGGESCTIVPERILLDGRYSPGMRFFAAWAWGQSISWVFRVEDIQTRLGLTRGQWRTLAKEMTDAGFMQQFKEPVDGSVPVHSIHLNFTIFEITQPCPQDSHSGAPAREGSKTTTRARGEKQPLGRGAGNNQQTKALGNQGFKEPPRASAGGGSACFQEEEAEVRALAQRLGLGQEEVQRFADAARGAGGNQLELLEQICRNTKARDPAALAIGLAKKAAAGTLTQPGGEGRGVSEAVKVHRMLEGLEGSILADLHGPLARVEHGRLRALRVDGSPFLHPQGGAELVARLQAGELDLHPPA